MVKMSLQEISALNTVLTVVSVDELLANAMKNLADSENAEDVRKADFISIILKSLR